MKTTTVEELLSWAFIFELPKVQARTSDDGSLVRSAWQTLNDFGELGTLIDRSPNTYGVVPGFIEDGDPHPDAIAAGDAVRDLAEARFDVPYGWNPFPEFDDPHGLIAAEVAAVVDEVAQRRDLLAGRHMIALVTTSAVLRRGPDWQTDQPTFQMVMSRGKPRWFVSRGKVNSFGREETIEEDGMDRKANRPKPGAYRKFELEYPLRSDILSRLDWQLWQDALGRLSSALAPRLAAHTLRPFVADRAPWRQPPLQITPSAMR